MTKPRREAGDLRWPPNVYRRRWSSDQAADRSIFGKTPSDMLMITATAAFAPQRRRARA